MRALAGRGQTATRLPRRALDRIESAGGSAYRWYDLEVTRYLDPSGRISALDLALRRSGLVAVAAALVGLAALQEPWAGVVSAVVLAFGLWRRRGAAVPWWASAIVTVATAPTSLPLPAALTLGAVMLALHLGSYLHSRDLVFGVLALTFALVTLGDPGDARSWVAVAVAGLASLTVLWWQDGRRMPRPFGRLTTSHLMHSPPPPPTRVPWLVRHRPGARTKMAHLPPEIQRKRAGGYGERRTAILLLGLKRGRGTRIVHDVLIPGAETANADHVVLARSGVFVLDSKQYGTREAPGLVHVDETGALVHTGDRGVRRLDEGLQVLRWATQRIGDTIDAPSRAVMVVHNAHVEPGLVLRDEDGQNPIDVIPATLLLARIDGSRPVMSVRDLSNSRWRLARLRSSMTQVAPEVTRPLGARVAVQRWYGEPVVSPEAVESANAPAGPFTADAPAVLEYSAEPFDVAERDLAPRPATATAPVDPGAEQVAERWAQMRVSEPAAPDDIPLVLAGVQPGWRVEVVEFADDGTLRTAQMVAASAPCQGINGTYLWVASGAHWRLHQHSGDPVFVATVHEDKIVYASAPQEEP